MLHTFQVRLGEEDVWSYYRHQLVENRRKATARRRRSWWLRLLAGGILALVFLMDGDYVGALLFLVLYLGAIALLTGMPGTGSLLFDRFQEPRPFFARYLRKKLMTPWQHPARQWIWQPMEFRLSDNGLVVATQQGEQHFPAADIAMTETLEHFFFRVKPAAFFILPKRDVPDMDMVSKWGHSLH